ncbi:MAG: hypothetical protein ACKOIA_08210, partial [Acidimicrobiia bacterium]
LTGAAMLAILPVVAVVGVWSVKFGTFVPSWANYEGRTYELVQYNMRQNGGELGNSARFIPMASLACFRPDTVKVATEWPFVSYRFGRPYGRDPLERIAYLPPANEDSINVEPTASVTNVAPIPLAATVLGALAIAHRRRNRYELLILMALTTPVAIMATATTIATRYLGDFYPLLAAGMAFGATMVPRLRRASWNTRAIVSLLVVGLTIVSVPIATALAAQYNWTYRFGIQ